LKNNLTVKQKTFVHKYLELGNATQAYKAAGYSVTSDVTAASEGLKLLRKPQVQSYLNELMTKKDEREIASADEVLKYLTSTMRNELVEEVVVVEGVGDGCSEARLVKKDVSIKERNKAAELLAKRYGILTERMKLDVLPVVIDGYDEIED